MTLKQIVKKYLEENNFAGLCSGECGCSKDDLFPCGEPGNDCKAALFKPCDDCPIEVCNRGAIVGNGCYYAPVKYGEGE